MEEENIKHTAEIIRDDAPSPDISEDNSIPFENWKEYEQAVEDKTILEPKALDSAEQKKLDDELKAVGLAEYEFEIDDALDTIDLTFPNYKPSDDVIDFFNIMRLVYGEDFETPNSIMQYFIVDLLFGNIKKEAYPYSPEINSKIRINEKKLAIIASRFSAKSTLITAWVPIYVAITGKLPGYGNVMFWVSFGDAQQAGAKVQANTIRDICEDSDFCKGFFEKMRFTDEECEFIRPNQAGQNLKIKRRAFMFKVKGAAGGSVRGIRYKTERPQILSFDDIIKNEADANSEVIMRKLKSMIYSDAENALGKKGKIIIVNTPFTKKDPVYQAIESGVWTPLAIPVCEKISLELKREDYVGSWEAMKTYEDIMEKYIDAYRNGTLREFNQELMLRIANEEDRLVKDEDLQFFNRNIFGRHLDGLNLYMTTDFTASNELKGDFSVVMMWAVAGNGDWFLMDMVIRRMTIDEQFYIATNMIAKWMRQTGKTVNVGVEVDGQQRVNIHSMKTLQQERRLWYSMATQIGGIKGKPGISRRIAGGEKLEQFMRIHSLFTGGKIFLPEEFKGTADMTELLEELKYITYSGIASKHDDAIDGISMIGLMEVTYPNQDVEIRQPQDMGSKEDAFWGRARGLDEGERTTNGVYSTYST